MYATVHNEYKTTSVRCKQFELINMTHKFKLEIDIICLLRAYIQFWGEKQVLQTFIRKVRIGIVNSFEHVIKINLIHT